MSSLATMKGEKTSRSLNLMVKDDCCLPDCIWGDGRISRARHAFLRHLCWSAGKVLPRHLQNLNQIYSMLAGCTSMDLRSAMTRCRHTGGESSLVQVFSITAAGFPSQPTWTSYEWILRRPNAAVSFTGSLLTVRALQPRDGKIWGYCGYIRAIFL